MKPVSSKKKLNANKFLFKENDILFIWAHGKLVTFNRNEQIKHYGDQTKANE
jgi:hypothetical protein